MSFAHRARNTRNMAAISILLLATVAVRSAPGQLNPYGAAGKPTGVPKEALSYNWDIGPNPSSTSLRIHMVGPRAVPSWARWCTNASGAGYIGDETKFRQYVGCNRGELWLMGNEPDATDQDNMIPAGGGYTPSDWIRYCNMVRTYASVITQVDSTARIANGALLANDLCDGWNVTNQVLARYRNFEQCYWGQYGVPVPVNYWNVHGYIHGRWISDIGAAAAVAKAWGNFYNPFYQWISTNRGGAYAGKPMIVSEFGAFWGGSVTNHANLFVEYSKRLAQDVTAGRAYGFFAFYNGCSTNRAFEGNSFLDQYGNVTLVGATYLRLANEYPVSTVPVNAVECNRAGASLNTTTTYQELPNGGINVNLSAPRTVLVTGTLDHNVSGSQASFLEGELLCDSTEGWGYIILSGTNNERMTLGQAWVYQLGAGNHPLRLMARSLPGSGGLDWCGHSALCVEVLPTGATAMSADSFFAQDLPPGGVVYTLYGCSYSYTAAAQEKVLVLGFYDMMSIRQVSSDNIILGGCRMDGQYLSACAMMGGRKAGTERATMPMAWGSTLSAGSHTIDLWAKSTLGGGNVASRLVVCRYPNSAEIYDVPLAANASLTPNGAILCQKTNLTVAAERKAVVYAVCNFDGGVVGDYLIGQLEVDGAAYAGSVIARVSTGSERSSPWNKWEVNLVPGLHTIRLRAYNLSHNSGYAWAGHTKMVIVIY
jgi:hypothetical protein